MTTEEHLMHLAQLKRQATTIETLGAYVNATYRAAGIWAPEAPAGIAILVLDGLIDALAKEHATA